MLSNHDIDFEEELWCPSMVSGLRSVTYAPSDEEATLESGVTRETMFDMTSVYAVLSQQGQQPSQDDSSCNTEELMEIVRRRASSNQPSHEVATGGTPSPEKEAAASSWDDMTVHPRAGRGNDSMTAAVTTRWSSETKPGVLLEPEADFGSGASRFCSQVVDVESTVLVAKGALNTALAEDEHDDTNRHRQVSAQPGAYAIAPPPSDDIEAGLPAPNEDSTSVDGDTINALATASPSEQKAHPQTKAEAGDIISAERKQLEKKFHLLLLACIVSVALAFALGLMFGREVNVGVR